MISGAKKFYLYIDDSGSRFPDKGTELVRADGMDHFALGGVLIHESEKDSVRNQYISFCKDWNIEYPLHSTKIRGRRNDFKWLEQSTKINERFLENLELFLVSLPVIGFAAVIHRPGYNLRYEERYRGKRWLMCKTAYTILVERVCKYVQLQNGNLEVRFEEVGKFEDRAIVQYARDLKKEGMPFNKETSEKYGCLAPNDFQNVILGEPKRKTKDNLFVQIADLYLYPMVKRKYEPSYNPWVQLFENKKVIDALLKDSELESLGIKYSCFDNPESKKPRNS